MTTGNRANVFVSYSHTDTTLVTPVVRLLRASQSLVFQDIDRIRPGKKWRSEIATAINQSSMVVVFWCKHAHESNEVMKEWKAALEQDKDLLPLLLDETPLPEELRQYQWIDFREVVGSHHKKLSRKRRRWIFIGIGVVSISVIAFFLLLARRHSVPVEPPPTGPLIELLRPLLFSRVIIWTFLIASVAYWIQSLFFSSRPKKQATKGSSDQRIGAIHSTDTYSVRCMAAQIESEIQARIASKVP